MLSKEFWKRYFTVYDILNQVPPYQDLLKEILKAADVKPGDNVLDVGVGTGNLALLLEAKGAKVLGIDFSEEALALYQQKNPQAQIITADIQHELSFLKDETFDVVVSNNVLYNIPRAKRPAVMAELKRVMKPGGRIVIANVHKDFQPLRIYKEAVRQSIEQLGFWPACKMVISLLIPTIKIFYYNWHIQKEYKSDKKNLFDYTEQEELLTQAGFTNVSKTQFVYAGQGVLNKAQK